MGLLGPMVRTKKKPTMRETSRDLDTLFEALLQDLWLKATQSAQEFKAFTRGHMSATDTDIPFYGIAFYEKSVSYMRISFINENITSKNVVLLYLTRIYPYISNAFCLKSKLASVLIRILQPAARASARQAQSYQANRHCSCTWLMWRMDFARASASRHYWQVFSIAHAAFIETPLHVVLQLKPTPAK
jgi:hypothetical protein